MLPDLASDERILGMFKAVLFGGFDMGCGQV